MNKIVLTGNDLTIEQVAEVARDYREVEIAETAKTSVLEAEKAVNDYVLNNQTVYGITTGFGKFSEVAISPGDTNKLQNNLLASHACGVGEPLTEDIVRAMMLLRLNSLVKGHSGIRLTTIENLLAMLNKRVYPVVYEKGSLGASGDLCPLAHMALVLIGKGEAWIEDKKVPGLMALQAADIKPTILGAKEGLALINGTQLMSAVGSLLVYDARKLADDCDLVLSMTLEALNGIIDAFDLRIHQLRPHPGQLVSAKNVLANLSGSEYISRQGELRVQDAYSLRCAAQVHGAARDAIEHLADKITIEINSATDNPLLWPKEDLVLSGGNFHGESLALALDYCGIALAELANISERRLERLVNPQLSEGLPAFLIENGGLNSGFMILQYSAAALVSENKVLAHPASVDSIPSSANQEDHVSMGAIAATKALKILDNSETVVAMELLAAAQALDLRAKKKQGIKTKTAYEKLRMEIDFVKEDRELYPLIAKTKKIIKGGKLCD